MAPYIGTPTSRVDGRAKVTGAAKYAAEFNVPGLAYGSVVSSTIAKGRILRIDTSEALRVKGVIDVLTHENRPRMADTDPAYKTMWRPKARRSGRSTTARSCSARAGAGGGVGDRPLRGFAGARAI
jgi:CO/xanthine dehydrogenase Mo-binding subunit